MVQRLAELHREEVSRPLQSGYLSAEAAAFYRARLLEAVATTNYEQAIELQPRLAMQLLQSGQAEVALRQFELFEGNLRGLNRELNPQRHREVSLLRALCHLRIAEQENCQSNRTCDSCIFPIREGGIHTQPRGAVGAVAAFAEHLGRYPEDLRAQWLLNIAHMTLGQYPDQVPARWLIPPAVFDSEYDIQRFPDVAAGLGLDVEGLAGGAIAEDFDRDGYLDLMVSDWSLKGQLRFFRNQGDGTFAERTAEAGLVGLVGGLNMMQTDDNNDGFADVFITRGGWLGAAGCQPNSLLRNRGDGTFEDVTERAGLLSFHPTQTATWFDFNGDGWLDVFIGNESFDGELHPCELYRNNGDGTFTECAREAGVAVAQFIKGVTSGDYNNDGRPDLYLSNRGGPNLLFRNDGPAETDGTAMARWQFTDQAVEAGVTEPIWSFPTWFWDYNNDGWLDLLVTGYGTRDVGDIAADYLRLPHRAERARLYRNNRDGTFTDATAAANLFKVLHAMGANFGDLDNDGWLDFYVGTGDPDLSTLVPNRMFRNDGGRRFQDVTTAGGFGHLQKGHGVAFADFDNDGDQDVFLKIGGAFSGDFARSALFHNPGHGNRWLTLNLEGKRSNRAAIGARIRVVVETPDGERSIYRTVGSGGSFGASPFRQPIGLGQATSVRFVEIRWPATPGTQVVRGLAINRFYRIVEDDETAIAWDLRRLHLGAGAEVAACCETHTAALAKGAVTPLAP